MTRKTFRRWAWLWSPLFVLALLVLAGPGTSVALWLVAVGTLAIVSLPFSLALEWSLPAVAGIILLSSLAIGFGSLIRLSFRAAR